jgi:hypothetical protein
MGFYISKDGFYVMSTLDSTKYRYLTEKGKMMTCYVKKIQKWWRKRLEEKLKKEYVIKIENWWIEVVKNRAVIKIQRWWKIRITNIKTKKRMENKSKEYIRDLEFSNYDVMIPFYFIHILILVFVYILN